MEKKTYMLGEKTPFQRVLAAISAVPHAIAWHARTADRNRAREIMRELEELRAECKVLEMASPNLIDDYMFGSIFFWDDSRDSPAFYFPNEFYISGRREKRNWGARPNLVVVSNRLDPKLIPEEYYDQMVALDNAAVLKELRRRRGGVIK